MSDAPLTHEDRMLVMQQLQAALATPATIIGFSRGTVLAVLEIVQQASVEIASEEYRLVMSGNVEVDPVSAIISLVNLCHGPARAGGWWTNLETGEPTDRNTGELLMLIVSEIAEAMEGHRKNLADDKLPQFPMFVVELCDALIRIFDLAGGKQIAQPLAEAFVAKLAFNAQREDHKLEARRGEQGKKY